MKHDDSVSRSSESRIKRVMFTLPEKLVEDLRKCADETRDGNKSKFVADAIRAHIEYLQRARHTKTMRGSYAAAAEKSRSVAAEWQFADAEMIHRMDKDESEEDK